MYKLRKWSSSSKDFNANTAPKVWNFWSISIKDTSKIVSFLRSHRSHCFRNFHFWPHETLHRMSHSICHQHISNCQTVQSANTVLQFVSNAPEEIETQFLEKLYTVKGPNWWSEELKKRVNSERQWQTKDLQRNCNSATCILICLLVKELSEANASIGDLTEEISLQTTSVGEQNFFFRDFHLQ